MRACRSVPFIANSRCGGSRAILSAVSFLRNRAGETLRLSMERRRCMNHCFFSYRLEDYFQSLNQPRMYVLVEGETEDRLKAFSDIQSWQTWLALAANTD